MNSEGVLHRLCYGERGFSLLELLVVCSILVVVAAVAGSMLGGVQDDTEQKLARAEMHQIRSAIVRFKQDTGYFPGEGPFAVPADSNGDGNRDCGDVVAGSAGALEPSPNPAWLESPANFYQLFAEPVLCANHPLAGAVTWNPLTGRGWRGPYLSAQLEMVDVGDGLSPIGSGDIVSVVTAPLAGVRGVADPFETPPVLPGSYTPCDPVAAGGTPCLLVWRPPSTGAGGEFTFHGRPYLYFRIPDPLGMPSCEGDRCLISMGPNGIYDYGDVDDIVVKVN